MSNVRNLNLGAAMLQRGKTPAQGDAVPAAVPLPVSEMAMVLTLDQLRPNPDNPARAVTHISMKSRLPSGPVGWSRYRK
ncbi:Uncharacterised protein [Enterobacter cloacae]|jgi:hypothetical protein|uniref:Uncharacterized protein n=1 Tax=Enterobacter cloacae TaxID=550 RepID=A0A377M9H3_ENTCL|nr:Uncharacterised protein [Enterobacter cloacae]